jgi:hypothetical protein
MGANAGMVNCAALPVVSLDFRALLHSLALCPCPPQYRHKPCTIRRSRSVCVNPPCVVRWRATGGLLRGPRATDVTEVAGAPDTVLRVLGAGVPRLVLVPGFGWASWQISACRSQYRWSTFCTKCFPLVERRWFFYKCERVLDAVRERLLQPVAECVVSPVDLAP